MLATIICSRFFRHFLLIIRFIPSFKRCNSSIIAVRAYTVFIDFDVRGSYDAADVMVVFRFGKSLIL